MSSTENQSYFTSDTFTPLYTKIYNMTNGVRYSEV